MVNYSDLAALYQGKIQEIDYSRHIIDEGTQVDFSRYFLPGKPKIDLTEINPYLGGIRPKGRTIHPFDEFITETPIDQPKPQKATNKHLYDTLEHALTETGYELTHDSPRVLSLGVGPCALSERAALHLYFLKRFRKPLAEYVGIDCAENVLSKSRQIFEGVSGVQLICADARNLRDHVDGQFDIVLTRHPDLDCGKENPEAWDEIYREARSVLRPDGRLIATSFWRPGYQKIFLAAHKAGYDLLFLDPTNPHPGNELGMDDTHGLVQYDQFILVAKPF